jgi:hypothetical protein
MIMITGTTREQISRYASPVQPRRTTSPELHIGEGFFVTPEYVVHQPAGAFLGYREERESWKTFKMRHGSCSVLATHQLLLSISVLACYRIWPGGIKSLDPVTMIITNEVASTSLIYTLSCWNLRTS